MHEFVRQLNRQLILRGAEVSDIDENTLIEDDVEAQVQVQEPKPKRKPAVQQPVEQQNNGKKRLIKDNWIYYAIGAVVGIVVVVLAGILLRPASPTVSEAELNVERYNRFVAQCEKLIDMGNETHYNELIVAKKLILDSIMPLEVSYKKEKPEVYNASSRLSANRMKKASASAEVYYTKAHERGQQMIQDLKDGYELYSGDVEEVLTNYKIAYQLDESRDDARTEYNELSKLYKKK